MADDMAKNRTTYYALLIAIDEYQHHDDLSAPVRDAEKFKEIITDHYGFSPSQITTLFNEQAALIDIKEAFKRYEQLQPDDALIISFAGHGQTDSYDRINYWLPCDAGGDSKEKLRWLDSRTVQAAMEKTPARHVLLLNDCCFSGDFIGAARNLREKEQDYLEKAKRYRAREVLTSGMSEQVQDSSIHDNAVVSTFTLFGATSTEQIEERAFINGVLRIFRHYFMN